MKVLMKH